MESSININKHLSAQEINNVRHTHRSTISFHCYGSMNED